MPSLLHVCICNNNSLKYREQLLKHKSLTRVKDNVYNLHTDKGVIELNIYDNRSAAVMDLVIFLYPCDKPLVLYSAMEELDEESSPVYTVAVDNHNTNQIKFDNMFLDSTVRDDCGTQLLTSIARVVYGGSSLVDKKEDVNLEALLSQLFKAKMETRHRDSVSDVSEMMDTLLKSILKL